jgi:hypothetical protein
VIDISTFQLLLTLLTGWLDRRERDVLRYLLVSVDVERGFIDFARVDVVGHSRHGMGVVS